jgi:hypothetical protein
VLALHHARDRRCAQAAEAGELALSLSPHHWGVPHALAACFASQGDFERADHYGALRDRIEPHVRDLVKGKADLASGYERN